MVWERETKWEKVKERVIEWYRNKRDIKIERGNVTIFKALLYFEKDKEQRKKWQKTQIVSFGINECKIQKLENPY